jgi:mono/diheme cytochrome c family protein
MALVSGALAMFTAHIAVAQDMFTGQRLYERHCAECHGYDGYSLIPGTPHVKFGEGLDRSDDELFNSIKFGKGQMPSYEGFVNDSEIVSIIVYTRSLWR